MLAVEHPITEAREAGQAVIAEGNGFAVHGKAVWQPGELGYELVISQPRRLRARSLLTSARKPSHLGSKA